MGTQAMLDHDTVGWLRALDPALSFLPAALPDASVGRQLHDVRWTPGVGCRLSYLERTPDGDIRFVEVDVTARGWSRYDYRKDAGLPGLAAAADAAVVAELLTPALGESPTRCRVEPVRFRSGSRCVLRYTLTTGSGMKSFYAKVFRPGRFDAMVSMGRDLAGSSLEGPLVPGIAATWPELHVLVAPAVEGVPVSAVLADADLPPGERDRLARQLGDLLVRFHAAHVPAPSWTAGDQVASLADAMAAIQRADPPLAARLWRSLDLLADSLPSPGPSVLSHGSFRPGQVVLTTQGTVVALDTDRTSRCDQARDLGAVVAHLVWQGIREPHLSSTLRATGRALLGAYQQRAGAVDPDSLMWWQAAGLLQVAVRRYRRLEVRTWPAVPLLADAVEELLTTSRGRRSHDASTTDLLDCAQMGRLFGRALTPVVDTPRPLRVTAAQLIADVSGRRRVFRYTVEGLEENGTAVSVIGKAFDELARARLLHEHLHVLSTGPFSDGPLRVPTPLALLPAQRMVLFRASDGIPLDRIVDAGPAAAGARRAAQWLAHLHSAPVRLPRRFSLDREHETSHQWTALLADAHPSEARAAWSLAARWATSARSVGDVAGEAPIHKDFHAGHVLLGEGVCVLDLDELRLGDPTLDLAHFCTCLEAVAGPVVGRPVGAAFLEEYAAATGWVDRGSYAPYCAYTWLKVAKQVTLGTGPFRGTPPPARGALVAAAIARGLACLDA